jgi:hypothetical protein
MREKQKTFTQELNDVKLLELELDLAVWRVAEWQEVGYSPEVEKSKKEVIKVSKKLHQALRVINARIEYGSALFQIFCRLNGIEKYLKDLTERVTYNLLGVRSKELA